MIMNELTWCNATETPLDHSAARVREMSMSRRGFLPVDDIAGRVVPSPHHRGPIRYCAVAVSESDRYSARALWLER
jgi:hypothetical protein